MQRHFYTQSFLNRIFLICKSESVSLCVIFRLEYFLSIKLNIRQNHVWICLMRYRTFISFVPQRFFNYSHSNLFLRLSHQLSLKFRTDRLHTLTFILSLVINQQLSQWLNSLADVFGCHYYIGFISFLFFYNLWEFNSFSIDFSRKHQIFLWISLIIKLKQGILTINSI